jgi:multicomponent Na+:H+ antiporter subunit E
MWSSSLLLALAWVLLTGQFSPANVIFGLALGAAIAWQLDVGRARILGPRKLGILVRFVAFVVWELLVATLRVAATVLLWRLDRLRPGIVAVPLDVESDAEITTLANLITLTPGTLSLDVSDDRQVLYVHVVDLDDADRQRRAIKTGFERFVRELYR